MTGSVTVDGPQLDEILASSLNGWAQARAVLLHELGHVVGLVHVDDPTQLMYGGSNAVTTFQAGDLAGLVQLGTGACFNRL